MKIRTILITALLVVGAGAAVSFFVRRSNESNAKAVEVVAVPNVNTASYNMGDSGTVGGTIISKDTQVVILDSSHDLVEVYVQQGDRVKKGDKLLEYDMLGDELREEMEELTKLGLELKLASQKKDLETLRSGRMPDYNSDSDSSDFEFSFGDDDSASTAAEDDDMSGAADVLADPSANPSSLPAMPLTDAPAERQYTGPVVYVIESDSSDQPAQPTQTPVPETSQESDTDDGDEVVMEEDVISDNQTTGGLESTSGTVAETIPENAIRLKSDELEAYAACGLIRMGEDGKYHAAEGYFKGGFLDVSLLSEQERSFLVEKGFLVDDAENAAAAQLFSDMDQGTDGNTVPDAISTDGGDTKGTGFEEVEEDETKLQPDAFPVEEGGDGEEDGNGEDMIVADTPSLTQDFSSPKLRSTRRFMLSSAPEAVNPDADLSLSQQVEGEQENNQEPAVLQDPIVQDDSQDSVVQESPQDPVVQESPQDPVVQEVPQDPVVQETPQDPAGQDQTAPAIQDIPNFTDPVYTTDVAPADEAVSDPSAVEPETNFNGSVYVDDESDNAMVGETIAKVNQFLTDVNNITTAVNDGGWEVIGSQMGAIESAMQQFRDSFGETTEHQKTDLFGDTVTATAVDVNSEVRSQVGEATASVMKTAYDRLCAFHFIQTMLNLNPERRPATSRKQKWFNANEQAIRSAVTEFTNLPDSMFIYNPATQQVEFSSEYSALNGGGAFSGESLLMFLGNAVQMLNYNYAVEENQEVVDTYSTEGEMLDDGYSDYEDDGGPAYTAQELQEAIKEQEKAIKETELQIREAELGIRDYKKILAGKIVYATMDGIVKSAGSKNSSSNSLAFITITGREGLYVRGSVNELSLDTIKVGDMITGTSYETGSTFSAEIVEISDYPETGNNIYSYGFGNENTNSSYYSFLAYIENAEGLSVDSYVDLSLTGQSMGMNGYGSASGLTLDEYFIRTDGNGRSYCFVRGEDGLLEKRYLEIGANNWGSVTIKSGLRQSDFIAFPYGKGVEEGAPTVEVTYLTAVDGGYY